jgi:hypothetical protein
MMPFQRQSRRQVKRGPEKLLKKGWKKGLRRRSVKEQRAVRMFGGQAKRLSKRHNQDLVEAAIKPANAVTPTTRRIPIATRKAYFMPGRIIQRGRVNL